MEMEPITLGPAPYSSPDPATDGIRMLPLEDGTSAAEAADAAAESREATNYASMDKADLVKLAEERDIEVSRGDGKDGDPVKADYVAALTQDDTSDMKAADWKEAVANASDMESLENLADQYANSGAEYKSVDQAFISREEELKSAAGEGNGNSE